MSSTRLPGKVMRPLAGAPMIDRQLERVARAERIDRIVVATSDDPTDDGLADHLWTTGVGVYRGSLDDVLARFVGALDAFGPADHVVRLTADCPLADPGLIDAAVGLHLGRAVDYTTAGEEDRTAIHGHDVEVVRAEALRTAAREAEDAYEREHVTPFINRRADRFSTALLRPPEPRGRVRWTVDTPDDFAFVEAVYESLHPHHPGFTTEDVLAFVRTRPDLAELGGFPRG